MNPETLASNHYQDGDDENPELITAQAKVEFYRSEERRVGKECER